MTEDQPNIPQKLVLVEYPGIVKNTDRMIKTLGGINHISEVFNNSLGRLPLKFHPDNVYNKPAMGDRSPGTGVLLKVTIRRPKDPHSKKPAVTKNVSVLGYVESKFEFKSMCDYQYLPIKTCPITQTTSCMYDELVPTEIVDPEWLTKSSDDDQYFMPPAAFARLDTTSRMFRKEVPKPSDVSNTSELIGQTRTRFRKPAFYISFSLTDPVPQQPPSPFASSEFLMLKFVTVEQFNQVKELFNRRPIMTKMFISYETKIANDKLKYIMPLLSYYYTTGPWRIMWVRFGYDPRKDFESRYYQQLDYRGRFYQSKWNQTSTNAQPVARQRPSRRTGEAKKRVESPYFENDRLPTTLQVIYQYCDIRVPRIQEMLDKIPTPLSGATCNEKSGWLPTNFDDQCREILNGIVKGLLEEQRKDESVADEEEQETAFSDDDDDAAEDDEMAKENEEYDAIDEADLQALTANV